MIDEEQRLEELSRYDILDTGREPAFDRLVELAAIACGAPIALLTLLDARRQWFKAAFGVQLAETARDASFCQHALKMSQLLVAEDATQDPRFAQNPFVTGPEAIRFYAGAPLVTPRGLVLGTLCVLGREPRRFGPDQRRALELLRDQVMLLLEDRRELLELRRSESLRREAVDALVATKADLEKRIALRTREAESARRRVEQVLARVADGFVALDRDWRYVYVNQRAAAMFGTTPDQLLGKHIWTEFPTGVGQPFHLAYERAMREQVPITMTDYYAPWDRWFENRIYPAPEGLTIFFTEITEQRRAEQALEEIARRLNEAQAVAHVGSWEWSVGPNRVVWSDEMFRIYGLAKESFHGSYEEFLSHVHPDDLEHTKAVIGGAYERPGPFVYDHRIVRPDGGVRMLHTRGDVMTDAAGRVQRMVGSCWDTTEQWQATEALALTTGELECVLESIPEGVLVAGDGQVRRTNARFAALFGVPAEMTRRGASAAALLDAVAARLRDGDRLRERVAAAGTRPDESSAETFHLVDGAALRCASRPYRIGDRVVARIWIFARANA